MIREYIGKQGVVETAPAGGSVGRGELKILQLSHYRDRVSTPNYQSIVRAKKELPVNPFTHYSSWVYTPVGGEAIRIDGLNFGAYNINSYTSPPSSCPALPDWKRSVREDAIRRLYANADALTLELGVTLGEFHDTISLVSTTARRLAGAYMGLRKGNFNLFFRSLGLRAKNSDLRSLHRSHSKDPIGFASSAWLEYSFGWVPLLQDVHSAAEAAAYLMRERTDDVIIRSKAKGRFSFPGTSVDNPGLIPTASPANVYVDQHHYLNTTRIHAEYKVVDDSLRSSSALGLTNPAYVAWNLLPFSFVVDWFLPIGNYLKSFTALQGLQFQRGHMGVSEYWSTRAVTKYWPDPFPHVSGGQIRQWPACMGICRWKKYERTVLTSTPSFPAPDLINRLGIWHCVTSLSLLDAVFGQRFRWSLRG